MADFLLGEDGELMVYQDDIIIALESHTDGSGTEIAIVSSIPVLSVKITSAVYGDESMVCPLRSCEKHNRVICYGHFKEWNSDTEEYDYFDPTDVGDVWCDIEDPDHNVTTYQYGVDGELEKEDTGKYYVLQDVEDDGAWYIRWYCEGTEMGSDETRLNVREVETTDGD